MIFPFTAIVGQQEMKTALILNVIDPSIGGLLIMGEKGTAKSTAVRALADLLPEVPAVAGCRFQCDPAGTLCTECRERAHHNGDFKTERKRMRVIELPLGVTEDRLVGTLDIERAIQKGEKRFEPGLLAEANRNFLYVDEVNLLEDHIVDLLLDSAAMGVNTVEREGISFSHPARFMLVGTMNPEEGDLRPQLLDRFGLCMHVVSVREPGLRVEILRRKAAFDDNPAAAGKRWDEEQQTLAHRIVEAQAALSSIPLSDAALARIVRITAELDLDGHRADIVMLKTARALAAFRSKPEISSEEIRDSAGMALRHRMKRLPFEEIGKDADRLQALLATV